MGTPPFQETESPEGELAGSFLVYCLCVAKVRNGSGGVGRGFEGAHPAA